jgi:hypothetical protein
VDSAPPSTPTTDASDGNSSADAALDTASNDGALAPADSGPSIDAADAASNATIDWGAVRTYLEELYDPQQSLVAESKGSATYWTANDNALAMRAFLFLPNPDAAKSSAIQGRLAQIRICGCADIHGGHDGLINHLIDPIVTKGAQIPLIPNGPCLGRVADVSGGGACAGDSSAITCAAGAVQHQDHPQYGRAADSCSATACSGGAMTGWDANGRGVGSADLNAFEILNYRKRGQSTDALWSNLVGKWDGVGINDASTASAANYATHKVALLKLIARVLGQPLPPEVDQVLVKAQAPNGAFRTTYALDGSFTVDLVGNAETTSYVTLAFMMPTTAL